MIHLEGVSRLYRRRGREPLAAIAEVDLSVESGEFVCVRGESGSGKSTLLLTIGAMLRPSSGRVEVAGTRVHDLTGRAQAAFRAAHIGFVFQLFHLLPYLDVRANIAAARPGRRGGADDSAVESLLERIGLRERSDHLPAQLSAGECQRVAVARALLPRPPLLLADEPTGNLDPKSSRAVEELFTEYRAEGGTILMVTHDRTGFGGVDRTVHLAGGRVVSGAGEHEA
ncbi:MAG: ATP-binding cassette domain-containing protein [Planctomycetota bacterium]|nr:ATP-binding cassette domain-containing protein [Planctomycetota bacterium]MDP6762468.1 ATP-binding cassette domain-containing protein [Planctomycetota bacterium]MDP6989284.1 ATP-binding cassette domain-containing protein [Planctomycetota bacterium]